MRSTLAAFIIVGFSSCIPGSEEEILAADFDQSCALPSDCINVDVGRKCCPSSHGAINKADLEAYYADMNDVGFCGTDEWFVEDYCGGPIARLRRPTCSDGVCTLTEEECELGNFSNCIGVDP